MNTHELAWCAGLFDGEGWVGTYERANGSRQLRLVVTQNDRRVLDRFRAAVGIGVVCGPYAAKNRINPQFSYRATARHHTQAVIAMLWTWLSPVKRAQAVAALADATEGVIVGRKPTCRRGHLLDEKNTGIYYQGKNYRSRRCRKCAAAYQRDYKQRRLVSALLEAV